MSANIAQNKAVVTRFYQEANDARRYDVLDEICAPDMIVHDPQQGTMHGREAFRGLAAFFGQAFPQQRTELVQFVAEGDFVVLLHVHNTVHTGQFNDLAPTGRPVRVPGLEMFRFDPASGLIAEFWRFDADLLLMMQLGAIPAPAGA